MNRTAATVAQKVVVINGDAGVLGLIESFLDAGRYDMVFVEDSDHAYSAVRDVRPNLVILCTHVERLDGFHVLTMLKLDPVTRHIPVLTFACEDEGPDADPTFSLIGEDEVDAFPGRAPVRMH